MQKLLKRLTAVILIMVMAITPVLAGAQEQPETLEATIQVATEQAAALMEALSIAGLTIAVVDVDSDFTWTQGFGYANVANQVPVTEYTLFSVGSTAKMFTAVAIMQLVEEGILDLDEPIVTYIPEFSVLPNPVHGGNYRNITTRMLLTHVSGIHEFQGDNFFTLTGQDRNFMNRLIPALADVHMQNEELNRVTYNNTAYTVLGILVARLTNSTNYFDGFVRYTRENIFAPVGMVNSSFEINAANRANIAGTYLDAETVNEMFMYTSATPTGGMVSNARDMALFMHTMLGGGGDILSQDTIDAMLEPQDFGILFPNDIPNMPMGLGIMYVAQADGVVTTGHGGTIHHHTEFLLDFDNGIGVFVSGNSATAGAVATPLANMIHRVAVEEKTGQAPQATAPRFVPFTNAAQLVGWYTTMALGSAVEVVLGDDGLLHIMGIPALESMPLTLTPAEDGIFESMIGNFRFREVGGIKFMFLDTHFGPTLIGERIERVPATSAIDMWVGQYVSLGDDEMVGDLALTIGVDEYGYAYINQGGARFFINEVDDNTFHYPGRIRGFGSIMEFSEVDGSVFLRYSGIVLVRAEAPEIQLRFVIGSTAYTYNGAVRQMDGAPFIDTEYGRTMIPLRVVAEVLGAQVGWISETRTATIVHYGVDLAISADEPLPGGMGVPHNVNGRIFVPLRYVAYAFGVDVQWDGANQAAYVVG